MEINTIGNATQHDATIHYLKYNMNIFSFHSSFIH
jgi:hypothetical protein